MFNHIDLEFEELVTRNENGERKYVTPDGNFPSITTILSRKKAKFFKEWRERIGAEEANKITTKATRRGTGMHTVVENYIANEAPKSQENDVELIIMTNINEKINELEALSMDRLRQSANVYREQFSKELADTIQSNNSNNKFKEIYEDFCKESHNELFDSEKEAIENIPNLLFLKGKTFENELNDVPQNIKIKFQTFPSITSAESRIVLYNKNIL